MSGLTRPVLGKGGLGHSTSSCKFSNRSHDLAPPRDVKGEGAARVRKEIDMLPGVVDTYAVTFSFGCTIYEAFPQPTHALQRISQPVVLQTVLTLARDQPEGAHVASALCFSKLQNRLTPILCTYCGLGCQTTVGQPFQHVKRKLTYKIPISSLRKRSDRESCRRARAHTCSRTRILTQMPLHYIKQRSQHVEENSTRNTTWPKYENDDIERYHDRA